MVFRTTFYADGRKAGDWPHVVCEYALTEAQHSQNNRRSKTVNKAPKLSITTRLGNAVIALCITCTMVASMDAMANYYVQQGVANQVAAGAHVKTQHA
jgi:hypothetical protein